MEKNVFLPISTDKEHMQNKKCDYKTLAIMTLYSNMVPKEMQDESGIYESSRYIYNNRVIKFTDEIEKLSGNKINTICKNMRKLSKLENNLVVACRSKDNEIYYVINYEDSHGRKYTTIHEKMLRKLINSTNSNVIKLYLVIKYLCEYEFKTNGNKEKKITNSYLAEQIGLCSSSNKNMNAITDMTDTLEQCGYIKKEYVKSIHGFKINIYYSICSYEEWENKQPSIVKKRKKKEK